MVAPAGNAMKAMTKKLFNGAEFFNDKEFLIGDSKRRVETIESIKDIAMIIAPSINEMSTFFVRCRKNTSTGQCQR
ncbi:hypothetical protein GCM10007159_29270 [Modicisalibacter luteus]|nr:hypothetical protein GCM10007159_29270 [Halomonas lutea]